MNLLECVLRFSRGNAEKFGKPVIGHLQPGAVIKISLIEAETAVILQIDQVIENNLGKARFAIGCEPHDLVFDGIDPEAREISER